MRTIVTFGEIMLRLSPPDHQRFVQARSFDAIFGGAEANVAVSLAQFGVPVEYVTRLPANDLGDACLRFFRQYGVGTRYVTRGGDRLGIYFLEIGAAQRGGQVIYDRARSALATVQSGMIDWRAVFADADWFHWTGITPAVSGSAAEVCLEAVQAAKEMGLTISCDLNYRSKLWQWGKTSAEVMPELVSVCDVAVGNAETAETVFGIKGSGADVCEGLVNRFPDLQTVALTQRETLSASHNTLNAILWHRGKVFTSPRYDITPIVDRVGSGDAFCAGLIYGLRTYEGVQRALDFAVAAACLKHTIPGDFNLVSVAEVERLMAGDAAGRVSR